MRACGRSCRDISLNHRRQRLYSRGSSSYGQIDLFIKTAPYYVLAIVAKIVGAVRHVAIQNLANHADAHTVIGHERPSVDQMTMP